jgi:hypothetical protein
MKAEMAGVYGCWRANRKKIIGIDAKSPPQYFNVVAAGLLLCIEDDTAGVNA